MGDASANMAVFQEAMDEWETMKMCAYDHLGRERRRYQEFLEDLLHAHKTPCLLRRSLANDNRP